MDGHGWSDIAYSWLVDQNGTIWEGRGWGRAGGHTENYNFISHAVCWMGGPNETPTPKALASIAAVLREAERMYGFQTVGPHNSVNATGCPGPFLTEWCKTWRETEDPSDPIGDDMFDASDKIKLQLLCNAIFPEGVNRWREAKDEYNVGVAKVAHGWRWQREDIERTRETQKMVAMIAEKVGIQGKDLSAISDQLADLDAALDEMAAADVADAIIQIGPEFAAEVATKVGDELAGRLAG